MKNVLLIIFTLFLVSCSNQVYKSSVSSSISIPSCKAEPECPIWDKSCRINNFEDCVKAECYVIDTFPRQCWTPTEKFVEELMGIDVDEHGCKGNAGYTFDDNISACIGKTELDSKKRKATKIAIEHMGVKGLSLVGVEGGFGHGRYYLEFANIKNERYWVTLDNWHVLHVTQNLTLEECESIGGYVNNDSNVPGCMNVEIPIGQIREAGKDGICCWGDFWMSNKSSRYCELTGGDVVTSDDGTAVYCMQNGIECEIELYYKGDCP